MMIRYAIVILCTVFAFGADAQVASKKPITAEDYAQWNTISCEIISNNGKFAAFEQNPHQGDGKLILSELAAGLSDTLRRGARPAFDFDSKFLVYNINPPKDSVMAAKRKKVKKEDMPMDSLGLFRLTDRRVTRFANVKSYSLPETSNSWISILTKPAVEKDTSEVKKKADAKKPDGDDLILYQVSSGDSLMFRRVTAYKFAQKGSHVIITQQHKDSTTTYSSITVFNTANRTKNTVFDEQGWTKNTAIDETGLKFAFLFSRDTAEVKVYSLYYGTTTAQNIVEAVNGYTSGMPVGWSPSENGNLNFSQDGTKLFFGTAPTPKNEPKDTLLPEEKPNVDVWHWKDPLLQTQQKVRLEQEKKRTWMAVYHTNLQRFIQLADLNIRDVSTVSKGNGEQALGFDNTLYQRASSWTGTNLRDAHLVDLKSGIKRLVTTAKSFVQLSPDAKYVVWYDWADSSYYAQSTDINDFKVVSLTKIVPVKFFNEENDMPAEAQPYGIAGWAPGDRFIYIYDRYDIWRFDLTGERVPVSVTQAFGRRNNIRFRYIKTDPEAEHIPSEPGILLRAFNEETRESGFYTVDFATIKTPEKVIMDKYYYSFSAKAKSAEKYLWRKENVEMYPDLWVSDTKFGQQQQLSHANPQQTDYNWTNVELVEWNSFSGEKLNGLLYKPENFNPSKKYPMVIYFYEKLSDGLYRHFTPAPSQSTINRTMYASNGYLVFVPDIRYKDGYPGQSAYNSIVSATQHLISKYAFIDPKKIGIQGQSWGGYQGLYLITQTDIFAAAMTGAPVSNMTSAYGGIRWESGMSRMFQYEQTQSRIGGTLWEKPLQYIENSPLFYAPKVETPLLIMHNDNDGAVPWYQGIEMFVALRRLDKPVWMLNYNNEPHNLKGDSWANRIDLDKRMFQFFNHYLKGQSMPEWMEYGVPAIDKDKKTGYQN